MNPIQTVSGVHGVIRVITKSAMNSRQRIERASLKFWVENAGCADFQPINQPLMFIT